MDRKSLGYLASHEWVQIQGTTATIGITQFAVEQLTDLILIELPAVGAKLTAGKSFGEIESVKAVSDLYAPVSGEVIEVNSSVTSNVQLLAEDPFDKGWLIKVKLDQPLQTGELLDLDTYEKKVADEAH
jgi:glycine cleavage system H protein